MKCRKLRIAWSVGCGVLCVLLIVLWVRSSSRLETISGRGRGANSVSLIKGSLFINARGFTFNSDDAATGAMTYSNRKPLAGGRLIISSTFDISDFDYKPRGNGMKLPMWLLIAVLLALSAVPWLPWWSTRFSLRTLLILTTLSAVGVALLVYLERR